MHVRTRQKITEHYLKITKEMQIKQTVKEAVICWQGCSNFKPDRRINLCINLMKCSRP